MLHQLWQEPAWRLQPVHMAKGRQTISQCHRLQLGFGFDHVRSVAGPSVIVHMTVDGMIFRHVKAAKWRSFGRTRNGAQSDCFAV